jgi:hypothetical protein
MLLLIWDLNDTINAIDGLLASSTLSLGKGALCG